MIYRYTTVKNACSPAAEQLHGIKVGETVSGISPFPAGRQGQRKLYKKVVPEPGSDSNQM